MKANAQRIDPAVINEKARASRVSEFDVLFPDEAMKIDAALSINPAAIMMIASRRKNDS